MKVVLVALNAKFIHSNLAVRSLKAYTGELDYECLIKEFSINDRRERVLEEIMAEAPDVIGFSCYIWNIEFIIQLANLIKTIDDSIEILYGGPEVSYDEKKFLAENKGEYLVEGEGEETFREFIEFKLGKKEIKDIKGLYYKLSLNNIEKDGWDAPEICYNGKREQMNINNTVFAYSEDDTLENKIVYYEASRGCPFGCKYCLSSTINGVRFLELERVKKELKFFIERKVRLVKFVDRTFNCNSTYAREIWEFLIKSGGDTSFHFEISADLLKDADISILSRAPKGLFQFEIGVQSTNEDTLKNISRYANFEAIKDRVERIRKAGNMKQHLDLIAGLPGENFNSFRNSFDDVYKLQPEEIQLGFLKLLKGSPMRSEAEKWGMAYSPYPPYEILRSRDISFNELTVLKRTEEMVDKYYNSGKFSTVIKYFLLYFSSPFDFYHELGLFFQNQGYFKRSISGPDYYGIFLEFNDYGIKENGLFLSELIKYDFLKYNKKKWLPDFLYREVDKETEFRLRKRLELERGRWNDSKLHIEKFRIDLEKFIEEKCFSLEENYYLFDEDNQEKIINLKAYL